MLFTELRILQKKYRAKIGINVCLPYNVGKEAIRELYQYVFENYTFTSDAEFIRTSETEQIEIELDGDLGYIWSKYRNTETPKVGGETLEYHGQSASIVRRQHDGSWKFARLIINSQQTTNSQ